MTDQKGNQSAKKHLFPGQSQKGITPQAKNQAEQQKIKIAGNRMGLNEGRKDEEA